MSLSKLIRAPPTSISNLYTKITTSRPPSLSPSLLSLIQQLSSKDAADGTTSPSNDEYDQFTKEMVSYGNNMLKLVSEKAEKMGSEQVYDEQVLDVYDTLVWGFNSPFLWRITESDIHTLYSSNVRPNHAEIGVGTGLFLNKETTDKCQSISLMDLNQNSLNVCEKRIINSYQNEKETAPTVNKLIVDITNRESIASHVGKYQSVAANFLFHCLHGTSLRDKSAAFEGCASLLTPDGVFIGSTILGKEMLNDPEGAGVTPLGVLRSYNEWGIFGNDGDSIDDLESVLNELFSDVEVKRVGYCGVWTARGPK